MALRWVLATIVTLSSALALAKPLVYCADASPEGFDPSLWDSASASNVTSQIFNGLVGFERGTTRLRPELASAWQIAPDARIFTFTLRRGVAFHATPYFTPTREFTADDFLAPNLTCASSRSGITFCDAEFDRLIEQGRATVDPERRNAIYREARALFKRERPRITMAHSSIYIPVRKDAKGFVMAPNGSVDFEGVYRE